MTGYTKIFSDFLLSSIWIGDDIVLRVWLAILLLSDSKGILHSSIPGLAAISRVSVEDCETAIEKLMAPDKYSRTKDEEGRRIKEIEGGWLVINKIKYRDMINRESRKEQHRKHMQEVRSKSTDAHECSHVLTDAHTCDVVSNVSHTYTDTHIHKDTHEDKREDLLLCADKSATAKRFVKPSVEDIAKYATEKGLNIDASRFFDSYESKGWMIGKSPMKDWKSAARNWARNDFGNVASKPKASGKGYMNMDDIKRMHKGGA